ncbi:acyl-CoA dehydrogenase, partial [Streptomyces sp. NPDC059900]
MGDRGRLHVSAELAGMLERIDALGGMLDERADAAEELGKLPDDTARALLDTGIVRAELPLSLGGYEFAPRQLIETVERASYHDAAAGWT